MVCPLSLSQACEGFIHYKKATGRSPHTILDYQTTLKKLRVFFKDNPPLAFLTREKLVGFFAWLQDGYLSGPDGVAPRGKIKLAPKSIANIHAWSCPGLVDSQGLGRLRFHKQLPSRTWRAMHSRGMSDGDADCTNPR
jgi:hypothetical protein